MTARDSRSPIVVLEQHYGDFEAREETGDGSPLTRLILMMLARGVKARTAHQVLEKLQAEYVDWNELRVTPAFELRKHLLALQPGELEIAARKADQLRELLSMVFNRINKMSLDFMRESSSEPDAARKREKISNWLCERYPALELMLQTHCSGKLDPAASPLVQRVVQRIGWTKGKAGAVAARGAVQQHGEALPPQAVQWRLALLAEDFCHARAPLCVDCPVARLCDTGKKAVKAKPVRAAKTTAPRVRK